jgi:NADH pyrophosphatase NudC (nudix superfamily)
MNAIDDYQKHTRIADEILSELHQTNLKTASVSRELADAAIAEQAEWIEKLKVCGNCGYAEEEMAIGEALLCCNAVTPEDVNEDHFPNFGDHCQFTPSRWTEAK